MFVCIAKTQPLWNHWIENAAKAIGRPVTVSLDAMRLPTVGMPSFLITLAEFRKEGDALKQLRTDELARRHTMVTFLVNVERRFFFDLSAAGLSVVPASDGDFAVVSGTVGAWVQAVVFLTCQDDLRKLGCLLLAWFELESLGECWADYEKDHMQNGLFRLIRKHAA